MVQYRQLVAGSHHEFARAARQIVEACRRGDAEAILSLPARVAAGVHGFFPALTSFLFQLVNRFLPGSGGIGKRIAAGSNSFSRWSPSWLTLLGDRAARRNNET